MFAACARLSLVLPLVLALGACFGAGSGDEIYFARSRYQGSAQPFPANYKAELLAFLRTYLNDPTNVREAQISEPVQRDIAGSRRYYVCVRYNARDSSGQYTGASDRAAFYLDGRFDRLIERSQEYCPAQGASYAAFPELERMTR